ncbi:MAG: urea ABC transporter ATP-binding subunit UrtE [Puniceicoccaceae bacterium MED-G30]|jgi:urea transport system ATP-binding protein|nr:MAG: urea ABC transporter ATP-binding subunit UrtE [Puniceicoccaceae bacterium MED-G30]RPG83497.1 MAG: urea ABC transporter ATP-binding subunit UrtE [Coraliomargarita sp. TMED73]|tara:strand:+ start:6722 stop:7453 length:732 start_codon:yes stop_codon:yes gene_type:complete
MSTNPESQPDDILLTVDGLKASYDESLILRGVDMVVPRNSVVALLGRNGVGKTTLLRSIMGLIPRTEGHIEFAGERIEEMRSDRRARLGLGYVPQGRDIFPNLTVGENLEVSLSIAGKAGKERLDQVYDLFPVIKAMLGRKGGVLSGGQQQQLAIGRALLTNPKLLILDEPTEGIQPSIIDQIEDAIHALKKEGDLSIILVEQYLDFAKAASDTFYILNRGCVVQKGESEALSPEIISEHLTV